MTAPVDRTNRLARETSPYLLQHAENPVDWYPWGDEAFEKARLEDKPVLVSIGYAACHWCHVMERESFENEETARLMNEHFINIKIDREERPDIEPQAEPVEAADHAADEVVELTAAAATEEQGRRPGHGVRDRTPGVLDGRSHRAVEEVGVLLRAPQSITGPGGLPPVPPVAALILGEPAAPTAITCRSASTATRSQIA